jgi:hypothetical protein
MKIKSSLDISGALTVAGAAVALRDNPYFTGVGLGLDQFIYTSGGYIQGIGTTTGVYLSDGTAVIEGNEYDYSFKFASGLITTSGTTISANGNLAVLGSISSGGVGVSLSTHTHTFSALTSKPTTISGYGITDAMTNTYIAANFLNLSGGTLTGMFNITRAGGDAITLTNPNAASQDKNIIHFKHYTDNREGAYIRDEVGYPSGGGWNGSLIFGTCLTMGLNSVAADKMVLDQNGNLKLLVGVFQQVGAGANTLAGSLAVTGNVTAANLKSLTAFGAKSGSQGILSGSSATVFYRTLTIDGVSVNVACFT